MSLVNVKTRQRVWSLRESVAISSESRRAVDPRRIDGNTTETLLLEPAH